MKECLKPRDEKIITMNIDTKRNVVIVGAVLAGLSIGAILAKDREKYNVTVYEKTSVIAAELHVK